MVMTSPPSSITTPTALSFTPTTFCPFTSSRWWLVNKPFLKRISIFLGGVWRLLKSKKSLNSLSGNFDLAAEESVAMEVILPSLNWNPMCPRGS